MNSPNNTGHEIKTTMEIMPIQIDLSVDEILRFYRESIEFFAEESHCNPRALIEADRTRLLNELGGVSTNIGMQVEAIILDRHENLDLFHAEALEMIQAQNAIPATLWPTLCFGLQHREYFQRLRNNTKWLIAPGATTRRTSYLHRICSGNFGNGELPQVLTTLINQFGPGRVHDLRSELCKRGSTISYVSEPINIPPELRSDDVATFAEQKNLSHESIQAATIIDPIAIDTEHRGAITFGYGESKYPRVLGIRPK